MQFAILNKLWYIDNNFRYPAIVIDLDEEQGLYSIMVYYGGIWESIICSSKNLIKREENWSYKMFEFRRQTMQIEGLQWEGFNEQ